MHFTDSFEVDGIIVSSTESLVYNNGPNGDGCYYIVVDFVLSTIETNNYTGINDICPYHSILPTVEPTLGPSNIPSKQPSNNPTVEPSFKPIFQH